MHVWREEEGMFACLERGGGHVCMSAERRRACLHVCREEGMFACLPPPEKAAERSEGGAALQVRAGQAHKVRSYTTFNPKTDTLKQTP